MIKVEINGYEREVVDGSPVCTPLFNEGGGATDRVSETGRQGRLDLEVSETLDKLRSVFESPAHKDQT